MSALIHRIGRDLGFRGLFVASVIVSASGTAALSAPSAVCDSPDYDFGAVSCDFPLCHTFSVRNGGDKPLRLSVAVACCGSKVSLSRETVPPGEVADVRVDAKLSGISGRVSKTVFLGTSDPSHPYLRLSFSGRVTGTVTAAPDSVVWTNATEGVSVSTSVVFTCEGRNFSVTNVFTDAEWLRAKVLPSAAGTVEAAIEAAPVPFTGRNRANVFFCLDAPPGRISVPVTIQRREPVTAYPNVILIPEEDSTGGVSRAVVVRSAAARAFDVVSVSLERMDGKAEFRRVGPGAWRVGLEGLMADGDTSGGNLVIVTGGGIDRELTVPIKSVPAKGR